MTRWATSPTPGTTVPLRATNWSTRVTRRSRGASLCAACAQMLHEWSMQAGSGCESAVARALPQTAEVALTPGKRGRASKRGTIIAAQQPGRTTHALSLWHALRGVRGSRADRRGRDGRGLPGSRHAPRTTVALKVIRASELPGRDRVERFKREARAISRLNHPHICALYDIGEQDGEAFLVMEYVAGETLAAASERGRCASRRSCATACRSLTRSTSPTATASSTAISSRATSCWRATV